MAETFEPKLGMGGSPCPDSLPGYSGPHYALLRDVSDARVMCTDCGSVFARVSS